MTSHLFVSFWALCLENLPPGHFERRNLSAAEARDQIRAARESDSLICVSKDDLFAPYRQNERHNHEALRCVLQKSFGIALRLDDFLMRTDDKDDTSEMIMPMQLARLETGDRLLVVTCNYVYRTDHEAGDVDDLFAIAEDTVGFHVIEALGPPVTGKN